MAALYSKQAEVVRLYCVASSCIANCDIWSAADG